MRKISLVVCLLALSAVTVIATASQLTGAGSTFVYPALSRWTALYQQATGVQINYQSIGSGGGIAQITAGTVDFAVTDKPLTPAALQKANLQQFPLIMGAIVIVTHQTTGSGAFTLDGPTLANIYLKKITYWDDPALVALNPGMKLPHQAITVVYRADGSGTTYNFTRYLSAMSPEFAKTIGSDTAVRFPTGIGAKGNTGVVNYLNMVPASIGYVEYAYAKQNHLAIATMKVDKKIVTPTPQTFMQAAKTAVYHDGQYEFKETLPSAWPMMAASYVLLPQVSQHAEMTHAFFQYVFQHPEVADQLDYVPVAGFLKNGQ